MEFHSQEETTMNTPRTRIRRRPKRITKKETGGCGLPLARLRADHPPVVVPFREEQPK